MTSFDTVIDTSSARRTTTLILLSSSLAPRERSPQFGDQGLELA